MLLLRILSPNGKILSLIFIPFLPSLLRFGSKVARQTRSSAGDSAPTVTPQNLLQYPEKELCTFDSTYLSALQTSGIFPDGTVFRPNDRELRSNMSSTEWLCFNAFPFTLGLRFPFSDFYH
ncbi:hypothetical protein Hanom_Chr04g00283401 [Helianthus anomalus]